MTARTNALRNLLNSVALCMGGGIQVRAGQPTAGASSNFNTLWLSLLIDDCLTYKLTTFGLGVLPILLLHLV